MKVMMIVWIAALSIAYLVAGRSFEQALLAGKIVLIGFVLGFVGFVEGSSLWGRLAS